MHLEVYKWVKINEGHQGEECKPREEGPEQTLHW